MTETAAPIELFDKASWIVLTVIHVLIFQPQRHADRRQTQCEINAGVVLVELRYIINVFAVTIPIASRVV
jgi:hypothetical protein